jgi:predicted aspartyl protease
MIIATGSFDAVGNPCVDVAVAGVFSAPTTNLTCIIDTGFTGFLSLPMLQAFPLGLPLYGTTNVTLADGSTNVRLLAMAMATVGGQTKAGVVILEPTATDVLLGMDFLRTFSAVLIVSQMSVTLMDEAQYQALGVSLASPASGPVSAGSTGTSPPSP